MSVWTWKDEAQELYYVQGVALEEIQQRLEWKFGFKIDVSDKEIRDYLNLVEEMSTRNERGEARVNYETTNVYVIREVATGKLIKFKAKAGWATMAAAKNAFNLHMSFHYGKNWRTKKGLYESQTEFVIEEVV